MASRKILFTFAVCILTLVVIHSCKKPPGPGGRASIIGKIYVKDFNTAAIPPAIAEYYGAGETVYICYGDETVVGNSVKTTTDGSFDFQFLRKGHYKVFALSRDTSIHVAGTNKTLPVSFEIDITGTKQIIDLKDITINK
jgi:hypothetical protein